MEANNLSIIPDDSLVWTSFANVWFLAMTDGNLTNRAAKSGVSLIVTFAAFARHHFNFHSLRLT